MQASAPRDLNQLAVLWRRRWILLSTVVVVVAATQVVSRLLTPIFETTATLIVAQPGASATFETTQANEEAARSYAQILAGASFAAQVAQQAGHGATGGSVLSNTTIQSVANTALITVTASDPKPTRAQAVANAYAAVLVRYAPRLTPETKATVTLADSAPLPSSAARPKPTLYSLAAALLGVMAGVGLAFLRERLDVRVRSVEELTEHTALPILATLPVRDARSAEHFAESIRMLRTTLHFVDEERKVRLIGLTSWAVGEGKTTIVAQLVLTLSAGGTRTIGVDGDAHRQGLRRLLAPETDGPLEPGLSDYVLGAAPLDTVIHETKVPALGFVPSGRPVPTLASLVETTRGHAVFDELHKLGDRVIVDCPPLGVGADALTLAANLDGIILVVDLRSATTTSVDRAIRQLESVKAPILGIVVNRVRDHPTSGYYEYAKGSNGDRPAGAPRRIHRRRALERNR